ncbi:hypothetical protein MHB54_00405 [Paenibacillus sp. FSL M7-0802]|uniref:hypothetical protein n=1 Tax=Paenibacillus sp. FSL M7-0802 TaxID=2921536 RepID=UPI0030F9F7F5
MTQDLKQITTLKEKADIVFIKITSGIYRIHKDRKGRFSGRVYVGTQEVLDALNFENVVILRKHKHGVSLHDNFNDF